jgi:hypothetical protein
MKFLTHSQSFKRGISTAIRGTHMNRLWVTTLAAILLATSAAFAQTPSVDILYLKNGSIIRGQVTELNSSAVKIKTADGSLFVYSMNDVDKMVKESAAQAAPVGALPEGGVAPAPAGFQEGLTPAPVDQGIKFGLRGGLFANLGIWDQLQGNPDSKIGFGFHGTFAAGINIDNDMYAGVGPLLGGSFWSQSEKISGVETSMTWSVMDYGANFVFGFDEMYLMVGLGSANVSLTATAGSDSKTVDMPESASFRRVSLGWGDGFGFGVSYVSYSDWAQQLSRFEINVGFTF